MLPKLRLALLALSILLLAAAAAAPAMGAGRPSVSMRNLVASLGGDPAQAGSAKYAYLNKLDGHVQTLAAGKVRGTGGLSAVAPTVKLGNLALVDVYVNGDVAAAAAKLRGLGMQVTATSGRAPERMVEGYLPVASATKAAALGATKAVVSVMGSGTDTGTGALSQGDVVQHGPQARALGPTGAGVTVGVMSDSMDQISGGISDSQATGDLPASVTDLGDDAGGEDEGRAMAEIIYDEAPGVTNMFFDTGTTGAANKASHIAALVSNGVNVIADDTFYLNEPMFQDGVVAQAADAAKAAGVAYVSSGGNRARQSWEGTFTPGAGGLNDFGGGDTRQAVVDVPSGTLANPKFAVITLQWDEPWGSAADNFIMSLRANNGGVITSCQGTSGIPLAACGIQTTGTSFELEAEISRVGGGTGTPKLKYIVSSNFSPFTIKEHATNSGAIDPDAASAKGALTTAAICWSVNAGNCFTAGTSTPESFSSRGPVVKTRAANGTLLAAPEVRQKPDLAGADGVDTSVPGFGSFFGTSAAAPSVAGVVALLKSAKPSLTVDQIYAIMRDPANSVDCTSAVGDPDTDCGVGLIQADRVVTAALDSTPPTITPVVSPATPDGAHGWYRSAVSVTWNVADAQSPVASKSAGCSPATISTDTGPTTITCTAASAGGSANGTVTIKRDGTPPSAPIFTGISAKTFSPASVPAASAVKCAAVDPTSGVDSCTVAGYSSAFGSHTLTATATNDAGVTSSSTLIYKVGCVVPKLKGKTLAAAKKALKKAGCKLGTIKPKHPSSKFRVSSSSPKAGTAKSANAKVKLTFKKKK